MKFSSIRASSFCIFYTYLILPNNGTFLWTLMTPPHSLYDHIHGLFLKWVRHNCIFHLHILFAFHKISTYLSYKHFIARVRIPCLHTTTLKGVLVLFVDSKNLALRTKFFDPAGNLEGEKTAPVLGWAFTCIIGFHDYFQLPKNGYQLKLSQNLERGEIVFTKLEEWKRRKDTVMDYLEILIRHSTWR
jgi:hypothetical protein